MSADEATPPGLTKLAMPKWGLSMRQGKVTDWLVAEGEEVRQGEELFEVETEKIDGAVESPAAGVLRRRVAEVGAVVPVGGLVGVLTDPSVPDTDVDAFIAEFQASFVPEEAEAEAETPTRTTEVGGRRLRYLERAPDAPAGDPVVLLHGFGGDLNNWLFTTEKLAERRRVYALDLPGHGESAKDVGDGSLDTLAATVLGFLDAVGVGRAHLVGHSLGGAVVTAVAAAAPDRVSALTLVSPAGFGEVDASYLRGFAEAGSRRELRPHLGKLFADESLVNRQLVDDLLRYKRLDGVETALQTLLGTLLDGDEQAIDAATLLAAVEVPVVVVWGRVDRVLAPADASTLGRAELRLVDDAGHMAHMEQPHAVVDAVEATGRKG
jgi:pyruvate dehydrogenase E2 component (dihydrolipoamide acetyltransferase)